MPCLVKICGITTPEDAAMVSEAGADYLGVLVNVHQSPRSVTPETAQALSASSAIPLIVLTFDSSLEQVRYLVDYLHPAGIQLAGTETLSYVAQLRNEVSCEIWKSFHLPAGSRGNEPPIQLLEAVDSYSRIGVDRIVLDTVATTKNGVLRGGTGQAFHWADVITIRKQIHPFLFLAGGINPGNVTDALRQVAPDGIDLSSGVEKSPGRKDPQRVKELIDNVRKAGAAR